MKMLFEFAMDCKRFRGFHSAHFSLIFLAIATQPPYQLLLTLWITVTIMPNVFLWAACWVVDGWRISDQPFRSKTADLLARTVRSRPNDAQAWHWAKIKIKTEVLNKPHCYKHSCIYAHVIRIHFVSSHYSLAVLNY